MIAAAAALFLSTAARAAEPRLPPQALAVPLMAQATNYSCGAAALLSTLVYWNAPYDSGEAGLYPLLDTTEKDGTPPDHIVAVAEGFGLTAYLNENMTLDDLGLALERGDTVIVDLQAWRTPGSTTPWVSNWEDGHYVVLVGMDAAYAYFMDPSSLGAYAYVPLAELPDRWHDYEDRNGRVWRTRRLGIMIRGTKARPRYPGAPVRML